MSLALSPGFHQPHNPRHAPTPGQKQHTQKYPLALTPPILRQSRFQCCIFQPIAALIIDNENDLLARVKEGLAQLYLTAEKIDRVAPKLAIRQGQRAISRASVTVPLRSCARTGCAQRRLCDRARRRILGTPSQNPLSEPTLKAITKRTPDDGLRVVKAKSFRLSSLLLFILGFCRPQ
jgi:hypothetical protein